MDKVNEEIYWISTSEQVVGAAPTFTETIASISPARPLHQQRSLLGLEPRRFLLLLHVSASSGKGIPDWTEKRFVIHNKAMFRFARLNHLLYTHPRRE